MSIPRSVCVFLAICLFASAGTAQGPSGRDGSQGEGGSECQLSREALLKRVKRHLGLSSRPVCTSIIDGAMKGEIVNLDPSLTVFLCDHHETLWMLNWWLWPPGPSWVRAAGGYGEGAMDSDGERVPWGWWGPGRNRSAPSTIVSGGRARAVRRTIEFLCRDEAAKKSVSPGGIRIAGVRFSRAGQTEGERFDLRGVDVPFPLEFYECSFEYPVDLTDSSVKGLLFIGCRSFRDELLCNRMSCSGNVWIVGCELRSLASFCRARIGGDLNLDNTVVGDPINCRPTSLDGECAEIGGDLRMGGRFQCFGEAHFWRVRVRGDVVASGGSFLNPGRRSLNLGRAAVKGSVYLNLYESRVPWAVLHKAKSPSPGRVLLAKVLALREKLRVPASTLLPREWALLRVGRQFARDAPRELREPGAPKVPQNLPKLLNWAQWSEEMDTLRHEHKNDTRQLRPELWGLACEASGYVQSKDVCPAPGPKRCGIGWRFTSVGEVHLKGTQIDGTLCVSGGSFSAPTSEKATAKYAVNLHQAHVGILEDKPAIGDEKWRWPEKGKGRVHLNCFRYKALVGPEEDAMGFRTHWLGQQDNREFSSQPYEHLIGLLVQTGCHEEARHITEMERRKMRSYQWGEERQSQAVLGSISDWLYGSILDYGYGLRTLFYMVFGLWFIGSVVFWRGSKGGFLGAPGKGGTPQNTQSPQSMPVGPVAYSLELLLPFLGLGEAKPWRPVRRAGVSWRLKDTRPRFVSVAFFLFVVYWYVHRIVGWGFTMVGVGGVVAMVR